MQAHPVQILRAFLHPLPPLRKGEVAAVFRHHEHVEQLHPLQRLFDQVPVTRREGIGVHNDGTDLAFARLRQALRVLPRRVFLAFHQQHVFRGYDGEERHVRKLQPVFRLRKQEQVVFASRERFLAQFRDDGGGQPLALVLLRYADALKDVAVQRTRSDDLALVVQAAHRKLHTVVVIQFQRRQKRL